MTRWTVTEGLPEPLGPSLNHLGLNVAVVSSGATAMAVSLFDGNDNEIASLPLPGRTGDVFHGHIAGVGEGTRYGFRAFGPWNPERGQWFNPAKLLIDPYATALDRPFKAHPVLFDAVGPNLADSAPHMPKAIVEIAAPPLPARAPFDWNGQIIQELHVRGFTMRHPAIPAEMRGTFAGLAHPQAISHLKGLGITAVELMPVAAWIDERHLPPLGLTNYWGYNPVSFLAPDPRLAPGGWTEIRAAVAALRAAGIAVIVDVVFNHTGEGDARGPTLSLRGLDDGLYYRRATGNPSAYVNDTGCGHTLALDRPHVWRLALDALRTWVSRGDIDGFRLDLATTLGRGASGFDPAAPLLAAIVADPILSTRAIIAEPWDIGPGGYQLGAFPAAWGEWNDRYRDTVRRFWRGDPGCLGDFATRFAGSADIFGPRHRPLTRSINFITAHDGFTLADLVSHEGKHNNANGEDNRDGTENNLSWNHGAEGQSDDPAILAARDRDTRALLATLLLSHGTPMLSMGDECGRTQNGNNNAYAQDNVTTWMDWHQIDHDLMAVTSRLIALRRSSPCLRRSRPLTGGPIDATLIPDVAWYSADGNPMTEVAWRNPDGRTLIVMLHTAGPAEDTMLLVFHADARAIDVAVPDAPAGSRWRIVIDTGNPDIAGLLGDTTTIEGRSVLVAQAETAPPSLRKSGASGEELDQLARAAGLASVWWDIEGTEHRPGDDTKRALLTAMRLPSRTQGDVRDSLWRLTAPRPLPWTLTGPTGQAIAVPIRPPGKPAWLTMRHEDGMITRIPVTDGQTMLKPAPMGRYQLMLDDDPTTLCHLTITRRHCFLPEELASGGRRFGIAAHLYSLRSPSDQGIGDFTTLNELSSAAARTGAAVIGLNPLHALFPGDRSRASPYYPSHRYFLDPIYIDVRHLPGADSSLAAAGDVNYPAVWTLKRQVLEAAFNNGGASDPKLDGFIEAGGVTLRQFARFEAIAASLGQIDWRAWPEPLRHPASPAVADFAVSHAREIRFVCYLQWVADRQFGAAAAHARDVGLSIGLYRDLAIGCAPDGAEAWAYQDMLMDGVSIGAPPDRFAGQGQNWGLPPPDPLAMARDGFMGFGRLLAANMRHAGGLRIDHVMGLRRLFLIPDGAHASDGTYLDYPFDDLLARLTFESQKARCLVVGEDLGTVPDGMRERLNDARVLSYRVLSFERDGTAFRPPSHWPPLAVACASTHDLPTSRGWWEGADIDELEALNLSGTRTAEAAKAERETDRAALMDFARDEGVLSEASGPADAEIASTAMHALIAATPSVLALAQADDLAGETVAVNLPGTDRERPNWRRRLSVFSGELCDGPAAVPLLAAMRASGRD